MRQPIRKTLIFVSLLLFPVTMNWMSPAIPIMGAFQGIVSGSLLLFSCMLLTATVLGRAWCGWACPMAGLSEMCMSINPKPVPVRLMRRIRYVVFLVWTAVWVGGFVAAGGVRAIKPWLMTDSGISVDEPARYIIYYGVLLIFLCVSIFTGKRGACHSFCWMSPFLVGGYRLGRLLRFPQWRIHSKPASCNGCKTCNRNCPMGVDVLSEVPAGVIRSSDCILCNVCVDTCPRKVLHNGVTR